MRVLIATAAMVLIVGPRVHAVECTLDDQQWIDDELPRLKSWSSIYESYRAYTPQCDDGFLAEGYTEAVVKMLSARWVTVHELARLARRDPAFRRFVLKHVDASADPDDLRKVLTKATRHCPRKLGGLCASLATAAKAALEQVKG